MPESAKSLRNPTNIILSLIILICAFYPLYNNYKYNDHSKNWLNHDYGKNLLSSTETYSVFMTEGGDNQVFSSLYFTYAEKLRQDVFPYDQKGNIFKRIYGDLRYVTYQTLQERSFLVNKGLFTGEEPFYTEIRSQKPPFLVPYSLGKPATYLTWKLSKPQELGDFYYKLYGQMYKVQEIQYAIIDRLEITGSSTKKEIKSYIEETLSRKITNQELEQWINVLTIEGYIIAKNNILTFIKSYSKPFTRDPSETFITRWNEIENLEYYDYLSREIVISFAYEQVNFLADNIENQQAIYQTENSETTKKAIEQDIQQKWGEIEEYITLIKKIGSDSAATLHNLGIFYLTAPQKFPFIKETLPDNSIELWELVIQNSPYAWSTYNILMWSYIRESLLDSNKAPKYLTQFDLILDQMTNNMDHFMSMKKDITNADPYKNVAQLIQFRNNFEQIAGSSFLVQKEKVSQMAEGNPKDIELTAVESYFFKVINQISFLDNTLQKEEFFKLWHLIWSKTKSIPAFFQWHTTLLGDLSGYGTLIDPSIFRVTALEGASYLPKNPKTQEEITPYINMYKIATITQDPQLITKYRSLLLNQTEKVLSPEQFSSFKQQVLGNTN